MGKFLKGYLELDPVHILQVYVSCVGDLPDLQLFSKGLILLEFALSG